MSTRRQEVNSWAQWLAVVHVNLISMVTCISNGLLSPLLASLLGPNPPFEVTKEQTTWVPSVGFISSVAGPAVATVLTMCIGSKRTIHVVGLCLMSAAVSLVFATSIEAVFISFLFDGLALGIIFGTMPVFVGEISNSKTRGGLMTFSVDGFLVGNLVGSIMGTYLSITTIGIICMIISGIYLITFSFLPHTPYYLVRLNKLQDASKAIEWYYRGIDAAAVAQEIDHLSTFTKTRQQSTVKEMFQLIIRPENRNAIIKLNIAFALDKLSSEIVILSYLEILFREAEMTAIAPSSMVILINIVGLVTGWIAIYTSDRFDRRASVFWASLAMALSYVAWGLCYQLPEYGVSRSSLQYIVIISATIYRSCINLGLTMLMNTIMSDMLPVNVRSIGVCICMIINNLCMFISAKNFQFLVDTLKYQNVFYLNAVIALLLGTYVKFFLSNNNSTDIINKSEEVENMKLASASSYKEQ